MKNGFECIYINHIVFSIDFSRQRKKRAFGLGLHLQQIKGLHTLGVRYLLSQLPPLTLAFLPGR